jgi:hypothetical protein
MAASGMELSIMSAAASDRVELLEDENATLRAEVEGLNTLVENNG